jgi:tRNA (cytidine/uridine-2'-O-)-methyltransferase
MVRRMRLALIEPDIAQNTGAILRLAACLDVGVDIIEPCGFVWSAPKLRRAGLDYLDHVDLRRHGSWAAYRRDRLPGRLLLLTTRGDVALPQFRFRSDDALLLGRESAGAPPAVHQEADARIVIPMAPGMRSLNVALAAALALGEALRQTRQWPALSALAS